MTVLKIRLSSKVTGSKLDWRIFKNVKINILTISGWFPTTAPPTGKFPGNFSVGGTSHLSLAVSKALTQPQGLRILLYKKIPWGLFCGWDLPRPRTQEKVSWESFSWCRKQTFILMYLGSQQASQQASQPASQQASPILEAGRPMERGGLGGRQPPQGIKVSTFCCAFELC